MVKHARLMMRDSNVGAFCFLETKTKDVSKIRKMAEKLDFEKHFIVDPLGFAGGLELFWRSSILDYSVVRHTSQAIHGIVAGLGMTVTRISFAYVRPSILAKEMFWSDGRDYAINNGGPWIMMGTLMIFLMLANNGGVPRSIGVGVLNL